MIINSLNIPLAYRLKKFVASQDIEGTLYSISIECVWDLIRHNRDKKRPRESADLKGLAFSISRT